MYYPLSAFLMLFANTLHNPEDPSTPSDIQLMDLVISVLSPMIGHTGPFNAAASLQLFQELRNVTKKFFESNYRGQAKTKRGYDSDVPKEDGPEPMSVVSQPPIPPPQTQVKPGTDFMVSETHSSMKVFVPCHIPR
jgi:hypothetical protein